MSLVIRQNSISPGLRKAARRVNDKKPILRVMGVALQNFTIASFVDPSKRMTPWAPKGDGSPSNLTKTTSLRRSIRITALTGNHVDVGTDRRYAAVHQLGGKSRPMPARPFFPFRGNGTIWPPAAKRIKRAAQRKLDLMLRDL